MEYETLLYEQDGPVVTLVYNRPEQHELIISMFMRRDPHTLGAAAFKAGRTPEWPHHGL